MFAQVIVQFALKEPVALWAIVVQPVAIVALSNNETPMVTSGFFCLFSIFSDLEENYSV
jgi:hypothetical protein